MSLLHLPGWKGLFAIVGVLVKLSQSICLLKAIIRSLPGDLFRDMLFITLSTVSKFCKFLVLCLCNMFFCSSFNHFALLLNFVCFSQILFQNYSTLFLVDVSLAVMLLPLKSPYTGFVLLLNLLWITCLTWFTARKTVLPRLWNIMERLKRPGKYYLYIKLLKILRL